MWLFHSIQHLLDHTWTTVSRLGHPSSRNWRPSCVVPPRQITSTGCFRESFGMAIRKIENKQNELKTNIGIDYQEKWWHFSCYKYSVLSLTGPWVTQTKDFPSTEGRTRCSLEVPTNLEFFLWFYDLNICYATYPAKYYFCSKLILN